MTALKAIWEYLKDWKNLLTHTIIGVGILLVALVMPVEPIYRILFLVLVVGFNIIRMRREKQRESGEEQA